VRFALGLVFCFVGFAAIADEPPERLKAIWEKREEWLASLQRQADSREAGRAAGEKRREIQAASRRLDEINKELSSQPDAKKVAELKKKLASPRWPDAMKAKFRSDLKREASKRPNGRRTAELKKEAKEIESRMAELAVAEKQPVAAQDVVSAKRADLTAWPELDVSGLSVGDVGRLPAFPVGEIRTPDRIEIQRAADAFDAGEEPPDWRVKRVSKFTSLAAVKGRHNVKIVQVLSDKEALAALHDIGKAGPASAVVFRLQGIDASQLADDSTIAVNGVMEVSRIEKYETINGRTKTVFVLEPFDVEQFRPFLK